MLKNIQKLSVLALFSVLMSSTVNANTIRHPTCNIVLTDLNAHVKAENDKLISELKQVRQFRGSQSRERIIAILERAKDVNINAMTDNALTSRGYVTSFGQTKKAPSKNPAYGMYDRKLIHLNATNIGTTLGADSDYFSTEMEWVEDMRAEFGMGIQAARKYYVLRFEKILWFSVELKIRNIKNNILETFYKRTAEVKVKNGDVNAAYEQAVSQAMEGAPNCEIITPEPEPLDAVDQH